MQIFRVGALALTAATVLTACGGGGGSAAVASTPSSSGGQVQAVTCDGVCFKVGTQP